MNAAFVPGSSLVALKLQSALALTVFLAAATLPYAWLVAHFGYDDILREPAAVILVNFQAGGSALVGAWLAFALATMLFVPVVLTLRRLLAAHGLVDSGWALLGVASAVAQAIGLMRWVLVVPALAAGFVDPSSSPAAREAALLMFDVVHRYGGMVIGEFIGQLLLAGWTAGTAWQLWRSRVVPRWLAAIGGLTVPLWLLGQTEVLQPVLPQLPLLEWVPLAFMGWELWLAAITLILLYSTFQEWRSWLANRSARSTSLNPPTPGLS